MLRRFALNCSQHSYQFNNIISNGIRNPRYSCINLFQSNNCCRNLVIKRNFFARAHDIPEHLKNPVIRTWNRVFGTIFGVNILIWLGWQTDFLENALPEKYEKDVIKLHEYLQDHATVSMENLEKGRYWTLITGALSHQNILHFGFNMIALYTFGSYIFHAIGFGGFSVLFLGSAITSSLAFILSDSGGTTQGISGVITGCASVASVITPLEEILILGITIPIRKAVIGLLALDTIGFLFAGTNTPFAHAAHLGGYLFGYLSTYIILPISKMKLK